MLERELPEELRLAPRESYYRRSQIQKEQTGTATNVLLFLALALLGTAVWPSGQASPSQDAAGFLRIAAVLLAGVSIFAGALVQHARLEDFRLMSTAARRAWNLARIRAGGKPFLSGPSDEEFLKAANAEDLARAEALGLRSWRLYNVQLVTVLGAMVALGLAWFLATASA